jgi:hypothetical protein
MHAGAVPPTFLNGGRYWDRTSGPCRVKRGYGAYESTICERRSQLQLALDITQCHDLTVPKLSQHPLSRRAAHDPRLTVANVCFWEGKLRAIAGSFRARQPTSRPPTRLSCA